MHFKRMFFFQPFLDFFLEIFHTRGDQTLVCNFPHYFFLDGFPYRGDLVQTHSQLQNTKHHLKYYRCHLQTDLPILFAVSQTSGFNLKINVSFLLFFRNVMCWLASIKLARVSYSESRSGVAEEDGYSYQRLQRELCTYQLVCLPG